MQDEDDKKLRVTELSGRTTRCLTRCLTVAGREMRRCPAWEGQAIVFRSNVVREVVRCMLQS